MTGPLIPVRFSLDDAQRAADTWGANCGPGAIAGVLGYTLDELRPHLFDFERKRYTNPTLMWQILRGLGVPFRVEVARAWPAYGLARIQWEGPWTQPGVPIGARYRRTHWVGSSLGRTMGDAKVFDINCICDGGWVSFNVWSRQVVPWLLKECEPKANGHWHVTHCVDIDLDCVRGNQPRISTQSEV